MSVFSAAFSRILSNCFALSSRQTSQFSGHGVKTSMVPAKIWSGNFHTSAFAEASLWFMHLRGGPPKRSIRVKSPITGHCQIRGVVLKLLIKKPKKPNSGNRKCVLVKCSNGKEVTAWIPGEGHNLQEHSQVLLEGGKRQDLIGVRCRVIRGKLDCAEVQKKKA